MSATHHVAFFCSLVLLTSAWSDSTVVAAPQSGEVESGLAAQLLFAPRSDHNHAPSLAELSDGSLIASWYRGSGERKADDVAVMGARKAVGFADWSDAFVMADVPGFPDCNTALHCSPDGALFLFRPIILANTWESCLTIMLRSEMPLQQGAPRWDQEQVLFLKPADFSDAARASLDEQVRQYSDIPERLRQEISMVRLRLPDPLWQRLGWQPRCKPVVLKSGRMLLPLYSDTFSLVLMAISDDEGKTWRAGQPTTGFGAIQAAVLERQDGTLVAFMRENGLTQRIRTAESGDAGETWGPVTSTVLPNPGSGLDGVRLRNGHWVLVYNDSTTGRNSLAVSLSTDEGRTWNATRHLEQHPSGSYHYPCVIQTRDGRIHVIYSWFTAAGKSMKHVNFVESWITAE